MKNNSQITIRRISSMKELKKEKARLRRETERTEDRIKNEYRLLIDAFTLRNVVQMVIDEVMKTSTVLTQAVNIGKSLFRRKKKQKKTEKGKKQDPSVENPESREE
jgi:hypothetical protein